MDSLSSEPTSERKFEVCGWFCRSLPSLLSSRGLVVGVTGISFSPRASRAFRISASLHSQRGLSSMPHNAICRTIVWPDGMIQVHAPKDAVTEGLISFNVEPAFF